MLVARGVPKAGWRGPAPRPPRRTLPRGWWARLRSRISAGHTAASANSSAIFIAAMVVRAALPAFSGAQVLEEINLAPDHIGEAVRPTR